MQGERVPRVASRGAQVLGFLAAACGAVVLLGWALDLRWIMSPVPGTVTMKPNTALGFVLAGLSVALPDGERRSRFLVGALASATVLLGTATLAQFALQLDLGIDQVLFREPPGTPGTLAPGRMAPTTAVAFTLVGVARWLIATGTAVPAAQRIALAVGLLGFLSMAGYACSATDLLGLGRYTQMAVHTAGLFVVVSLGLLFLRPRESVMRIVTSRNSSGWLLRRMLPVLLTVPLAVGWLGVRGAADGHWTAQFGVVLVVVLLTIALTVVTYRAALSLEASDAARLKAEAEHQAVQEQLSRTARLVAMGTLVAGVAHEVNNPLAAVTSSAGLAREEVVEIEAGLRGEAGTDRQGLHRSAGEVVEMLDDVLSSAERIGRIVKDLALLARTGTRRQTVSLADVVRHGLGSLSPSVAARARIRTEISETAPVRASEGQLEQVILNLVTNAALAIPDERVGEVVVRVRPGAVGTVRLEVSDDGQGIDPGIRDRIFEPFFTTRALGKGTGLGLSICYAIVTDHGGTISVATEVGKGSTFSVELPAAPVEENRSLSTPRAKRIGHPA